MNIKKFDMKKLKEDSTILLIGKRRSGKSFLLRDILYHKRDIFPAGIVISGTEEVNPYFEKFIPKMFIYNVFTKKIIDNVFQRQRIALSKRWENPRCFFIMDDCLDDVKKWSKTEEIIKIFTQGRHYDIFFILAMQEAIAIPQTLRGNIDYVFLTKNNNQLQLEKIYKNYAGVFSSFKEFKIVFNRCTENNNVFVIDMTSNSNKIEECVFYYKAEPHEFKMFSPKIWEESDRIYNNKEKYTNNNIEIN